MNALTPPRHRLLLELGRGGMGTVYLATSRDDAAGAPRLVVVKRLNPELTDDPEARKMFVDEARICARIAHPNVVRTLPAFQDADGFGLEMEFLEGQPLDVVLRWARSGGAFPIPLAVLVVRRSLAGLHAAHELRDDRGEPLRVVHRDVSPHNVFVLYDGGVKVLDFGIAKAVDNSARTRTGVVKGKLAYMAPEQASRGLVDRRADVFSAGIVLWEAVVGRRFWPAATEELELLARLQRAELPPLDADDAHLPPALVAILARATSARAEDRFASAADFERALEGFARDHGCDATDAELGAFVATAFEERRVAMAARVADRLRAAEAGAELELVPSGVGGTSATRRDRPAAASASIAATRTLAETGARARAASATPARRGRWIWALVAAASLASIAAVMARRAFPPAPPAAAGAAPCARDEDCAYGGSDLVCGAARACVERPRCKSNAACTREHGGEAHVCRVADGRCQRVASQDCEVHAEAKSLEDDRTIWLGTMFPLSGPDGKAFGVAHARAAELARQDFMRTAAGVSTPDAKAPPRPLAIVSCDDASDPERVARHLVDDVGVPAVVGFRSSKEVVDLATSIFIPKGVLAISALNGSPAITQLPHPSGSPRLVFRTATNSARTVEPWTPLVEALLPRPAAGGPPAKALRVALVRSGAAAGIALSDAVVSGFRFNGKSVAENGADFRELVYGDPTGKESAPTYDATVRALVEFAPHVILYALMVDETKNLLEPVERGWRADVSHRPFHLVGGAWEGADFLRFLGRDAARRRRFLAVRPPSATPTNVKFTLRYNETFPEPVSPSTAPSAPYDSVYLLAYAAFVAGDAPLTGSALARAIPRLLPPGQPAPVGAAQIFTTFEALRSGRNVDLQGAWSRLDFDVATGDGTSDFVVTCPGVDAAGNASDAVESGLLFDAESRRLLGELRCP